MAKSTRDTVPAFSEAVRAARQKLGLSQGQVAELAGCGNSAVADVERGDRSPSLSLAARLAAALRLRTKLADFAPDKGAENNSGKSPD